MEEGKMPQNEGALEIRLFEPADVPAMREIWNQIVIDGRAFPQEDVLATDAEAEEFFASQTATAVAVWTGAGSDPFNPDRESVPPGASAAAGMPQSGEVLGLCILHPNNIGRCGHIANTSYAVAKAARGKHVGAALVTDSLHRAKACGFRVLQFNAVVASNASALHLYEKLGFTRLGAIPGGFRNVDGEYEDIYPHYYDLTTL